MSKKWKHDSFNTCDKEIRITGPADISISIDYDDVDHPTVKREIRKLVRLLNTYWGFRVGRALKRKRWTAEDAKATIKKVVKSNWKLDEPNKEERAFMNKEMFEGMGVGPT